MEDVKIIDLTPENIADYGVCGYKDVQKHIELKKKIEWFKEYYPRGLRIKTIFSQKGGYQGMLEYIPGGICSSPGSCRGIPVYPLCFCGIQK